MYILSHQLVLKHIKINCFVKITFIQKLDICTIIILQRQYLKIFKNRNQKSSFIQIINPHVQNHSKWSTRTVSENIDKYIYNAFLGWLQRTIKISTPRGSECIMSIL